MGVIFQYVKSDKKIIQNLALYNINFWISYSRNTTVKKEISNFKSNFDNFMSGI